MAEQPDNFGTSAEPAINHDALPETANTGAKPQSGRAPARPPYEQNLRVNKVLK